jgi:pantothenate kinase
VCPGFPHDTYSNRNGNYQRTMLYYISNIVTIGLTLLQSIEETILNLYFGSSYSTGTVDWGYTCLVLLEHLKETSPLDHHLVPIRDFC